MYTSKTCVLLYVCSRIKQFKQVAPIHASKIGIYAQKCKNANFIGGGCCVVEFEVGVG